MAAAIIASGPASGASRIALSGDATQPSTLRERLADLEAQKDLALSLDVASSD